MEKIETLLIEITQQELEKCKNEKRVPSKEVLDTIETLINISKI